MVVSELRTHRSIERNLGALWWLILGALGLFFPFYTLYLKDGVGLSGTAVGIVAATLPTMGLVAQPLWGRIADRTGSRTRVLVWVCIGASVGYSALAWPSSAIGMILGTLFLAFFSTALIPSCVSVSLASLPAPNARAYGRVRVLGTIGFAVSVGLTPYALRLFDAAAGLPDADSLGYLLPIAGGLILCAAWTAGRLPTAGPVGLRAQGGDWRDLFRNGRFVRVLIFSFLTYLFTQGAMVLFPLLIRAQGGGLFAISHMWLLMLALEVPLVMAFGSAVERIGARGIIAIGTLAAAARWLISGFSDDIFIIGAVQILHGVTVWGIILALPFHVDRVVPPHLRATAQGLLAMVGVSLGSILSNLGAGWLTDRFGSSTPARIAGVACLMLAVTLPLFIAREKEDLNQSDGQPT